MQATLTTSAGGVATISLPAHHMELAVPVGDENKSKQDKGTCTTERCGENQVHCQASLQLIISFSVDF